MQEATRPIAMIPSDCFRWQPRVQFVDSFRTREAALNCAFEHGYNLIVERSEGNSALFDVLDDPEGSCTSGLELEQLQTEEVLVDPYAGGWASLMLSCTWNLTRRLRSGIAGHYARQVVTLLRHAASSSRPAIQRVIRRARRRITRPSGFGAPRYSRHSSIPACCKVKTFSLSAARFHARRFATRAVAYYHSEIVPFCRTAASRSWWSDPAIALRRSWYRHSQGSVADAARRLTAEASVLYAREVTPRLRYALSRCRQADIQGACRRAWRVTLLAAIRLTDRSATAIARLYVRELAPRLHSAAARYQQADIEGTFRRSLEAVTPPRHSNASQVH